MRHRLPSAAALSLPLLPAAALPAFAADMPAGSRTLPCGKLLGADIIAMPGDLLANLSVVMNIDFVMKDGAVYREPTR